MQSWWRKTVTGDSDTRVRDHFFGSSERNVLLGHNGRNAFAAANAGAFNTVIKNRELLEALTKRENTLEKKIEAQMLLARKKNAAKDKRGALFCLKKKKMYEAETIKIQNTRLTIESQIMSLEGAVSNAGIVQGMAEASEALRKINDSANIDKVEGIMDDIQDGMADQQEINDIISQPVGMNLDEDDLLSELDALVNEDAAATRPAAVPLAPTPAQPQYQFPDVPQQQPVFPAVPTHALSCTDGTDEELRALQELEASMAGI
jgi:charged multivesicular body protein 4